MEQFNSGYPLNRRREQEGYPNVNKTESRETLLIYLKGNSRTYMHLYGWRIPSKRKRFALESKNVARARSVLS
eukprot:IDg4164t1